MRKHVPIAGSGIKSCVRVFKLGE